MFVARQLELREPGWDEYATGAESASSGSVSTRVGEWPGARSCGSVQSAVRDWVFAVRDPCQGWSCWNDEP